VAKSAQDLADFRKQEMKRLSVCGGKPTNFFAERQQCFRLSERTVCDRQEVSSISASLAAPTLCDVGGIETAARVSCERIP
jgi:hypothetical protein